MERFKVMLEHFMQSCYRPAKKQDGKSSSLVIPHMSSSGETGMDYSPSRTKYVALSTYHLVAIVNISLAGTVQLLPRPIDCRPHCRQHREYSLCILLPCLHDLACRADTDERGR